jgi:hypothetical protein
MDYRSTSAQTDSKVSTDVPSSRPIGNPPGIEDRSIPGAEFHKAIYRSVVIAFAWIMMASWLAFGGRTGTNLDLAVASLLFTVILSLPIIICKTAAAHRRKQSMPLQQFLAARVDTATGEVSGAEAWLQVLLIPLALAFAALAIGGVYVLLA